MMNTYEQLEKHLKEHQYTWLITGVAGFIGSNLMEALLKLNQKVVGLDNFSTGYQYNLDEVLESLDSIYQANFTFIEGDIRSIEHCQKVVQGVDYVLHQAALGSVPRSINDPKLTYDNNETGFLNILIASRNAKVKRFVYASSSAVYGDSESLPKVEHDIGQALSPYAVTKYVDELYAHVFASCYGTESIGLRYFNVFGARQDPKGAYAAVIPLWFDAFMNKKSVIIYGDGETSRDFCYIDNVVQANLLAAMTQDSKAINQVYNVAVGERTTLNQLFHLIRNQLKISETIRPEYRDFRIGDVRHSLADITKMQTLLNYKPLYTIEEGLKKSQPWYENFFKIIKT